MDHRARLLTSPQQPAGSARLSAKITRHNLRAPGGQTWSYLAVRLTGLQRTGAPGRGHGLLRTALLPGVSGQSGRRCWPGRLSGTCPPDAQVVVPGPGVRLARAAPAAVRRSVAVLQYLRHYGRQPRVHPAGGTRRPDRGPGRQEGPGRPWFPVRQPRRHSRRAGGGTGVPGPPAAGQAALVPASAGPPSRRPGHARVPCARRPGGHRRHLSRKVCRAPGSRPPGPLRLAATRRQDAPPGRRPPARSPVGGHQGAAHWQSRRWPDGRHTA